MLKPCWQGLRKHLRLIFSCVFVFNLGLLPSIIVIYTALLFNHFILFSKSIESWLESLFWSYSSNYLLIFTGFSLFGVIGITYLITNIPVIEEPASPSLVVYVFHTLPLKLTSPLSVANHITFSISQAIARASLLGISLFHMVYHSQFTPSKKVTPLRASLWQNQILNVKIKF